MAKSFRISALLLVLVIVAGNALQTRFYATDWDIPLEVVVYPINGDGRPNTTHYINTLDRDTFAPLADFFTWEADQYNQIIANPVTMEVADEVSELPAATPYGANIFSIMWWSLKMRYWAWKVDNYQGPAADIKIFVLYYDPEVNEELAHSVGLAKGMICLVKAYASRRLQARNNVIIAHELLHALGATDKYDLATGQPIFPAGYADPEKSPLYPQDEAEIMGGVIALSETEAVMPESLRLAMIGPQTAREINWPTD